MMIEETIEYPIITMEEIENLFDKVTEACNYKLANRVVVTTKTYEMYMQRNEYNTDYYNADTELQLCLFSVLFAYTISSIKIFADNQ